MTVTDGRAGHFRTVSAVDRVRPGSKLSQWQGVKPLGIGQEIGVGLMGDNPRLDPIHRDGFPLAARKALHRRRCASAILARPAVVFGPVDSPPWKRQRRLPGSTLTPHGLPWRLRAPHIGRSFRGNGMQLPFKPCARSSRQSAPILQQWSEQVCRSFEAGQAMKP